MQEIAIIPALVLRDEENFCYNYDSDQINLVNLNNIRYFLPDFYNQYKDSIW